MGFIIWYKVEFKEQTGTSGLLAQAASALPLGTVFPLRVSNDVFSGKYILDVDITLTMGAEDTPDKFSLKLTNLPEDVARTLKDKQLEGLKEGHKPFLVEIYLGYFDEPTLSQSSPVMRGAVLSVKNTVDANGLLNTVVEGQEIGAYKLRTKSKTYDSKKFSANDLVEQIGKDAGVQRADGSTLPSTPDLNNFTLKATNGLAALREIAYIAQVPLVIRDDTIYIGPSVGRDKAPVTFDPDLNIVKQDLVQNTKEIDEPRKERKNGQVRSKASTSLTLTVLGHPRLRVGQQVEMKDPPAKDLRINEVTHNFSTTRGYTCDLTIVVAEPGKLATEQMKGPLGLARSFRDVAESVQGQKQAIDVGEVTEYESGSQKKHRATLNYGQSPSPSTTAPSVDIEVDDETLLHSKPVLSPFAWRNCGLIVPVYPGMRALLAHNLGMVNDAIVTGFLWPEKPTTYDRPKNEEGDYWLCLPTAIDTKNKKPQGKGVNDLTDKNGLRVIQAKGLKIFVGKDKLPDVGERPAVPDAQTIVIEHESGTKITIGSDGAVKIEATGGKEITLTNRDATGGGVTLKLGSSGVEVS